VSIDREHRAHPLLASGAVRVLALDFDGVIADSAREAFAVAVRTFGALHPTSCLAGREDDAAPLARFLELMPLGNRAEDYAVALMAIERGVEIADQAAYDAFYRSLDAGALRTFHRRFYQVRAAWAQADPEGWLAHTPSYPAICELLRRRAGEAELAIATSKDRRSVGALLEAYGIADLFEGDRVLDKETGVRKRTHVELLARRFACPAREVTFVDDKVNHLFDVASLGARCALAAWGYNGERERREAERAGFLVCELADVEARLFGPAGG
jgi:phosphoglycolate phosphatase-like HAD superfamily hydrolase